jgi:hypothetical protein
VLNVRIDLGPIFDSAPINHPGRVPLDELQLSLFIFA